MSNATQTVDEEMAPVAVQMPVWRKKVNLFWRQRWLFVLILPAIAVTFVFNYIPLYGITLAFRDYNAAMGPFRSPFSRPLFYNFWFLRDPEFWYVLGNTVRISTLRFVFGWPCPIILALLLNEVMSSAYKRTIQTITYLPHFVSWVILAGIIYKLLDFEPTSPVNVLRSLVGLDPIALMGEPDAFIPILIISGILKEVGWGTIIYLATISKIDPQLYESAHVDGAGKLAQTWYITLPGMVPTISILLVLSLPGLLSAGFDQIYNLMNPRTMRIANVTDIYVLRVGLIQANYSLGTAIGLVFGVLGLTLTMIANKASKSAGGAGIW